MGPIQSDISVALMIMMDQLFLGPVQMDTPVAFMIVMITKHENNEDSDDVEDVDVVYDYNVETEVVKFLMLSNF